MLVIAAAANPPPEANQPVRAGPRPGAPARQRATYETTAVLTHRQKRPQNATRRRDPRPRRCALAPLDEREQSMSTQTPPKPPAHKQPDAHLPVGKSSPAPV
ncbi:hypothetical protein PF005_g27105 [Phytophthora fragariae]|uniref:Uncharacterized protein n=1 Tax=Phytophthora fragariae TaxID=53985 RepID=A0A6A3QBD0_9STRA|nr:hypothetical protein PF009_g27673 [Phytophthora fragariae]KAE8971458.1 hypothetical protein PF011_g26023 [Phytophthora fragariae]KAE9069526.1 hypothetical protein PF010_g26630 [Phytophthora fragariae]KAE9072594.1 hypothetical protein PF007_g26119 [Phytophthora fragariae]KAE9171531.1 hypothetical protein PF005_g27105 [Phytophthora fragariae]